MSGVNLFVEFRTRFQAAYTGLEFKLFPTREKLQEIWDQTKSLFPCKNHTYIGEIDRLVQTLPVYPQRFNVWTDLVINLDRDLRYLSQINQRDKEKILDLMFQMTLLAIRLTTDLLKNGENGKQDAIMLTCSLSSPVSRYHCDHLLKSAGIVDPRDPILRQIQSGELGKALEAIQELKDPFIHSKDTLLLNVFQAHLGKREYEAASNIFEKITSKIELFSAATIWAEEDRKNPGISRYLRARLLAYIVSNPL